MAKLNRKEARERRGIRAWIRLDGGFSVRPCILAGRSGSGVRLMIDAPFIVAPQFVLLLSRNAARGHRCRVVWRRGREISAVFVKAA